MKRLSNIILVVWVIVAVVIFLLVSYYAGKRSTSDDGIEYRLYHDGTASVVGYSGTSADVAIPETYEDHTVTEIDSFMGNAAFIKRIEIPATVTEIGNSVFNDCTALIEIVVDEKNQKYSSELGDLFNKEGDILIRYAIGKEYPSYQVPDGIVTIGMNAFSYSPYLRSVIISDSVEEIEEDAFSDCARLDSVELGNSVKNIESNAFCRSYFITEFSVDKENPDFCSIDGNLYSKDESALAFYAVGKSAEGFVIPDTVAVIGGYAFAFADSLLEVTIPEGVERIEDRAFYCCDRLLEIRIPSTVKYIGREALQARGLTSAVFTDVVGWRTKDWPDDEVIIYISEEDLKNPSIAAKYLTNDYTYYSWTKE